MSRLAGPGLARQLRGSRPGLKVLFRSGTPGEGTPEGADAMLRKPFRAADLVAKARQLLADG